MKLNSQYFTLGALVMVSGLFWFYYSEYQDKAEEYSRLKRQYDIQVIAINQQQERIQHLAELDKIHTQELVNAKTEIDRLHTASLAHPERVYIKAKCPVPEATATSGMDDAATARPTDSAIRNYWLLRDRIATSEQIIQGLQEYVRTQCG
ncbi:lysis protein [Xenorhabdus sp. KK7.4]|uniref:lysis protein n=1 Tax=Xenorhabdus sp. KK7.4 TaxID=1851572 RepID=UPI000C0412AE|nr:lysis protein [Xenorhabdus sp. KK7.4]PHM56706.1 phosphoprotein phosphatase [Xenorhabdus sp. KK7.4]